MQSSKYLQIRFLPRIIKWSVITLLGCIGAGATILKNPTFAQNIPNIPPTIRDRVEETIPKPLEPIIPTPTTPTPLPTPLLQTPATPQPIPPPSPTNQDLNIKKIEVLGNTVLKDEINNLVKKLLEKKEITFEDLITLRTNITELYFNFGYITSGAFLPNNQDLNSGTVQIQVVEGELERIEINGLTRLQKAYILRRLSNATKSPLNRQRLEEGLQLLQIDPLLEQVNAELTAGTTTGRNILQLNLREAPAFHASFTIANNQSPSVGEIQGSIGATHDNLLGFGDRLILDYGRTDALNLYNFSYTIPFLPLNGALNFSYNNNDSRIIEDSFQDLGIRSETETFSVGLRQPIVQSPQTEFSIGVALDVRRSQTFILDNIPFSFSEGPSDGKSRVTVIRFSTDWVNRSPTQVLAARSQFNFGIGAFNATINNIGTDGRFFSWLGQFQWVQQLAPRAILLTRINTQLTPDSLLSLERFSIGGVDTLRGYRQNQLVSDNGVLASVELRLPVTANPRTLQLTPFFEIGSGWNNRDLEPDPNLIAGLGLGAEWQVNNSLNVRIDYGIPLIGVKNRGDSLQDNGLYFSLRYHPF